MPESSPVRLLVGTTTTSYADICEEHTEHLSLTIERFDERSAWAEVVYVHSHNRTGAAVVYEARGPARADVLIGRLSVTSTSLAATANDGRAGRCFVSTWLRFDRDLAPGTEVIGRRGGFI